MDPILCLAQPLSLVLGCTEETFARTFGDDLSAWHAAFLTLHLDKPISFRFEGDLHFVAPFDWQLVGQNAKAIGAFAIAQEEATFDSQPGPPVVAPPPKVAAESPPAPDTIGSLRVYEFVGELELNGVVRLVARSEAHAKELFAAHWDQLRPQFLESVTYHLEDECIQDQLKLHEVAGQGHWDVSENPMEHVEDYPRLF